MGFYGKGGSRQLKRFKKISKQIDEWNVLKNGKSGANPNHKFRQTGGIGEAANKKLSKFEEFLLNDWDAKMISKLTGRPPWEGTPGLFQKPGQWIVKKLVQTVIGNLQRWRGAIPRIKAFFGDSDVYMKLLKRCITSGRSADDCVMVVGQLRPSFGRRILCSAKRGSNGHNEENGSSG